MINCGLEGTNWCRDEIVATEELVVGYYALLSTVMFNKLCFSSTAKNMSAHGTLSIPTLVPSFSEFGTDHHAQARLLQLLIAVVNIVNTLWKKLWQYLSAT